MADDQQDFVDSTPKSRLDNGRFAPGFSGNDKGGPKRKWFRDAFIKHFEEHPEDFAKIIAETVSAAKGEQTNRFSEIVNQGTAAAFVKETLDGKAKQEVEVTGEDGGPIGFAIIADDMGKGH